MTNKFDTTIARTFAKAAKRSSFMNGVMIFCARYLIFVLAGSAATRMWQTAETGERLSRVGDLFMTAFFAWVITFALEYLINRKRPFETLDIKPLVQSKVYTPAFPSGHATIAFALATFVFFFDQNFGTLLLGLATIVSISRVSVGVHWTSDVVAGTIVGIVVSWAAHITL